MAVRVEFFGIARQRAGVAWIDVDAADIATALRAAGERLPNFAAACLANGQLRDGLIINVNGRDFTSDRATPLADGDSLLILSADVGG